MKLSKLLLHAALFPTLLISPLATAQLAPPNAAGFTGGHTHLGVADVAQHREIWLSFGAREVNYAGMQMLAFPGMYILLAERHDVPASIDTSANHIGFTIRDYAHYKTLLQQAGANLFFDDAENGQILADLPGGVRVEFAVDAEQQEPILFHHTHLAAIDGAALRDWYVKVFGAEVGERRGLPSAVIPGARVDILPVRGDTAPLGSRGSAIDHIGFDVTDMDAFAAHLAALDIPFEIEPRVVGGGLVRIAFITDPVGTFIEITEGLIKANQL
jgi:catechol 2,3-dioxygenase-like lactoylglutathione lyase family enzyme